ncbi:hypothetical protein [Komagataeibacter oboediens]|nr:hypothetical protein [Komagataeibacter oboediens]
MPAGPATYALSRTGEGVTIATGLARYGGTWPCGCAGVVQAH